MAERAAWPYRAGASELTTPPFRIADSHPASPGWHQFTRTAPMTRAFNHLIAGQHFAWRFQRWPLPPDDPAATVNDVIFATMIEPHWPALHRAFVDKETAKAAARRLLPGVRVPETLSIIPMDSVASVDHLHTLLRPFIGTAAIAKPTHASGATVFLRAGASPADLVMMHDLASIDYAVIMREMQYRDLPRKIIVEAMVPAPTASPPDDYKFHCVRGEPLLFQVDHNRFGVPWSRLFRLPDVAPMDANDGLVEPDDYRLPSPDRLAAMTATARVLSAPFDYVRVDLYDGADGVYFGELTFTPAASLGIAPSAEGCHRETATHREYSRTIMTALRQA